MKLRKEHVVILLLLLAFVAFFLNAVIVVNDRNARILELEKKNESLRNAYDALQRDHGELRKDKMRTIAELRERLNQYEHETADKEPENR
jgi:Tfp pilus assembly protein PilO